MNIEQLEQLYTLDYESCLFENSITVHADCFEWMSQITRESVHAIVSDPPYGVKEYDPDQLEKRTNGNGGIWRIPPSFDGHKRSPLPRFTALNHKDRERIRQYFSKWSALVSKILRPGGHVFLASNAFLSPMVFTAIAVPAEERFLLEQYGDAYREYKNRTPRWIRIPKS